MWTGNCDFVFSRGLFTMSWKITHAVKGINRSPELKPLHDLNEEAVNQAVVVHMLEAAVGNRHIRQDASVKYLS